MSELKKRFTRETPVLFAFHGYGINGTFFRSRADLLSTFGASDIVLHPDAIEDPSAWDNQGGRDIAFFDTLLESISTAYGVDADRVFVTGHSYGGMFTNCLGCVRGDVIRGNAPMSGAGPNRFDTCKGPPAAVIFHGIDDPTVTLRSGEASRNDVWNAAGGRFFHYARVNKNAPTFKSRGYFHPPRRSIFQ